MGKHSTDTLIVSFMIVRVILDICVSDTSKCSNQAVARFEASGSSDSSTDLYSRYRSQRSYKITPRKGFSFDKLH